jgi:hypothetical protein
MAVKPTPPSEDLVDADVEALIRAKMHGHEPVRSLTDLHWRCVFCGYVAVQVRWWPTWCSDAWKAKVRDDERG